MAEDEPELLRFYKILLEDLAFEVVTARDGQECIEEYVNNLILAGGVDGNSSFNLVILDHKMPRMNGMEVADQIAAKSPPQKLLMITAYEGFIDLRHKAENMKVMPKQFDVDKLVMTIQDLVRDS